MRPNIPPEFEKLFADYNPELARFYETPVDLMCELMAPLKSEEKDIIQEFLAKILDGRYTDTELSGIIRRLIPVKTKGSPRAAHALLRGMHEALEKS